LKELAKVEATGGTNICEGLRPALDIIQRRKVANNVTSIFLLSDGLDNNKGAESRIQSMLKQYNIQTPFTIHMFGYGSDHDEKLMHSIAELQDGNFYYIEKLETVDECFVDCLGGLISVVGQDVSIVIKTEPSEVFPAMQITKAYGYAGMWKIVDGAYATGLTHLISGKKLNYVFEIQIPKTNKILEDNMRNIKIASAMCSVQGLKGSKNTEYIKQAELITGFFNETEELKDNESDRDVVFHCFRVRGAEIINEAKTLSDKRKYEEAKTLLKNFKEEIVNSVLKDDPIIKNLIKDIEETILNVREENYEDSGKYYMTQNYRSQMCEKSCVTSNMRYGNDLQEEMIYYAKSRKS